MGTDSSVEEAAGGGLGPRGEGPRGGDMEDTCNSVSDESTHNVMRLNNY